MQKVTSALGFEKLVNRDTQRLDSGTEVAGRRVHSALACPGDKPSGQAGGREEIWLQVARRLQKVPHVKDLNLILRFRESLKDYKKGDDRDKRVVED